MTKRPGYPLDRKELRRALRLWERAVALGSSPLATLRIVERARQAAGIADSPTGQGIALRSVLQAALERIRPDEGDPQPDDELWRDYLILTEQYVRGRAKGYLAEQMHVAASTYDHAQAAALDRLLELLAEWEEAGAVSGETPTISRPLEPPPAPLMAPQRLPDGLVGRDELLTRLKRALLGDKHSPNLALHGLPGVGKTALAIELCHDPEVRTHYPDGVLWAALGPDPDPAILLHLWELALGFASEEVSGLPRLEDRAKALHAAIGARRMLLVLDDVWQAESAELLRLGGPHCATVFTTRMPGLAHELMSEQTFAVPELDGPASMEMLGRVAPQLISRLERRAQELVEATGGLPLALELLGRALRKDLYSRSPRRLTEALARLRDPAVRLGLERERSAIERPSGRQPETLATAIALSAEALDEESRLAFYALSLFPPKPNSFDEPAAAAVTGGPIQTLDRLVDAGLLDVVAPERYAVQRTLSDYGRLRSSDSNVRQAFARYYLDILEENREAFHRLDRDIHNLLAAVEIAQQAGLVAQFIRAANSLFPYLESAGLVDQAQTILEQARDAAQELDGPSPLAEALANLGRIALRRARHPEAVAFFTQALQLAESIDEVGIQCACLQGLGSAALQRGVFPEAERHYREALRLAERDGLRVRQAGLLSNLGVLASNQGKSREAEEHFRAGLGLARELDDRHLLGTLLTNLGVIAARGGRLKQAEGFLNESLDLALAVGNRRTMVFLLSNLGTLAHDQGDDGRAWALLNHALVQARGIGDYARIGHILANLAALATQQHEFEHADALLREGLDMAREQEHQENLVLLLINSGQLAKERGELKEAVVHTEAALKLAAETGHARYGAHARVYLGELYLLAGDLVGARRAYRAALTDGEQLGMAELQADALFGLAKVEAAGGRPAHSRKHAGDALKLYTSLGHRKASDVEVWLERRSTGNGS